MSDTPNDIRPLADSECEEVSGGVRRLGPRPVTTLAIGEEDGGINPIMTTMAMGEEDPGGAYTSLPLDAGFHGFS